jgi:hypothetical protein
MQIDVDVTIWSTIETKGPKLNNINMEVDVDVVIWSTTKTKAPNLVTSTTTWPITKIT